MSDPRYTDPRLSDPTLRRDESVGGMWGWIAGLTVLALIAFVLVAGWNSHGTSGTASNHPAPVTTGSTPMRNVTPPSTTGSGTLTPRPATPTPAAKQ